MAFEGGIRRTKQLVPSFAFNFNHKLAPGLSLAGSCPKLEFIIFLFSVFLALQLSATILSLLVFYLHELIPFWLDCCKIHFLSHKLSHSLTHNTRNTHTHTHNTQNAHTRWQTWPKVSLRMCCMIEFPLLLKNILFSQALHKNDYYGCSDRT